MGHGRATTAKPATSPAGSIADVATRLRELAMASRERWTGLARDLGAVALPTLSMADPLPAQLMARSAQAFCRQLPFADAQSETELRGIAMAMSNVLRLELQAQGALDPGHYWSE